MRKTNYPWSKGAGAAFALLSGILLYFTYRICHEWILLFFSIGAFILGVPMLAIEGKKKLYYVLSEVEGHRKNGTEPDNYDRIILIATLELFGIPWLILPVIIAFCGDLYMYVGMHIATVLICTSIINKDIYYSIGWEKKYTALQIIIQTALISAALIIKVIS